MIYLRRQDIKVLDKTDVLSWDGFIEIKKKPLNVEIVLGIGKVNVYLFQSDLEKRGKCTIFRSSGVRLTDNVVEQSVPYHVIGWR